jgi:hypothetical protein
MNISVEKKDNIKVVTVSLPGSRKPADRKEYKTYEMEEILREKLNLNDYSLVETTPVGYICNYQKNNVGVYTFSKSVTKTEEAASAVSEDTEITTPQTAKKADQTKKRKNRTTKK